MQAQNAGQKAVDDAKPDTLLGSVDARQARLGRLPDRG